MTPSDILLPAEWHPAESVLIAWPHVDTDWNYMLPHVSACFREIAKAITDRCHLIVAAPDTDIPRYHLRTLDQSRITYLDCPTNDTWARDFGPVTTFGPEGRVFNDFRFNGWGLKFAADRDNLITRRLGDAGLLDGEYTNRLGMVLEGGSIESDGAGTILTTSECLLSPNRNGEWTQQQIEDRLKEYLGATRVLWLDYGALAGDDTDSHIDTLARFLPGDTIAYVGCQDPHDWHYEPLQAMKTQLESFRTADGRPYNLVELPMPFPIIDADDQIRLPATYANFLLLNGAVLLPVYGQPEADVLAIKTLGSALPDWEIVPVDCRALIRQHGSLHCVTMQIPQWNSK